MGTIFYPPGWDGPVDPNGQVVAAPGQPPAPATAPPAMPAPPAAPPPAPPPPAITPIEPAGYQPAAAHRRRSLSAPSLSSLRGAPLAVVAAVLAIALIAIAWNQNSTAKKWRHNEQIEATRNADLTSRLTSANASITNLSSQVTTLQGHVSHLKTQLSAAANAKEKAIDQEVVLKRIASDAGRVSDELSGCVNDMRNLITEIAGDISTDSFDPYLEQNATVAGDACASAQNANSALQSELGGLG